MNWCTGRGAASAFRRPSDHHSVPWTCRWSGQQLTGTRDCSAAQSSHHGGSRFGPWTSCSGAARELAAVLGTDFCTPPRPAAQSCGPNPGGDIGGPVLQPQLCPGALQPVSSPHRSQLARPYKGTFGHLYTERGGHQVPPALTDYGPSFPTHTCHQRSIMHSLCPISLSLFDQRRVCSMSQTRWEMAGASVSVTHTAGCSH